MVRPTPSSPITVPLTIAAATLPWLYSIVLSGLALLGYTLMLVWYDPLTLPPFERATLQVYGMWLSFAPAAALITFFVARMASNCAAGAAAGPAT